jgi:hypothetical protein
MCVTNNNCNRPYDKHGCFCIKDKGVVVKTIPVIIGVIGGLYIWENISSEIITGFIIGAVSVVILEVSVCMMAYRSAVKKRTEGFKGETNNLVFFEIPISPEIPISSGIPISPEIPISSGIPISPEIPISSGIPISPEIPISSGIPMSPKIPINLPYCKNTTCHNN